ncbi:DnaJ family domain-containing protein [Nocardioides salsibiostraticola]
MTHQQSWVDQQIRVAMARGDFDNLPGAGKPIKDLDGAYDPDWWLKKLVEREQISVLPPSLQLRKDDAELDARLDAFSTEGDVRREVEEFNARVMKARYDPTPRPPLITLPRDTDAQIQAWRTRRAARRAAQAVRVEESRPSLQNPRKRWWQRSSR